MKNDGTSPLSHPNSCRLPSFDRFYANRESNHRQVSIFVNLLSLPTRAAPDWQTSNILIVFPCCGLAIFKSYPSTCDRLCQCHLSIVKVQLYCWRATRKRNVFMVIRCTCLVFRRSWFFVACRDRMPCLSTKFSQILLSFRTIARLHRYFWVILDHTDSFIVDPRQCTWTNR